MSGLTSFMFHLKKTTEDRKPEVYLMISVFEESQHSPVSSVSHLAMLKSCKIVCLSSNVRVPLKSPPPQQGRPCIPICLPVQNYVVREGFLPLLIRLIPQRSCDGVKKGVSSSAWIEQDYVVRLSNIPPCFHILSFCYLSTRILTGDLRLESQISRKLLNSVTQCL